MAKDKPPIGSVSQIAALTKRNAALKAYCEQIMGYLFNEDGVGISRLCVIDYATYRDYISTEMEGAFNQGADWHLCAASIYREIKNARGKPI